MKASITRCFTLAMVGDSDIAYWPGPLLPNVIVSQQQEEKSFVVSGQSGDTLEEILPRLRSILQEEDATNTAAKPASSSTLILVVCAGENDIGSGITLDKTLESFERLLALMFDKSSSSHSPTIASHNRSQHKWLIFLGPKLEPWLVDDPKSRKQYVKMSKAMEKACRNHPCSAHIVFVNCLTMFCGDTATVAGAILGGKAVADPKYFAADGLHLNECGYRVWKRVVEEQLLRICNATG